MRAIPLAYGLVITAVLLLQAGRSHAQDDAAPAPEFQYRSERTDTFRFLVQNVDLVHADWHESARKTGNPSADENRGYGIFLHTLEGGELKEGSGIALIYRYEESQLGAINTSNHPFWKNILTVYLPDLVTGETVTFDLSAGNESVPLVFWSFYGHYREDCYAYPTGGTITLKRIPDAYRPADPESGQKPESTFASVVADFDIRFDKTVTSSYNDPDNPDCSPFALTERVIFHNTPLEYIPWWKKPEPESSERWRPYGLAIGIAAVLAGTLYGILRRRRRT